MVGQLASPKKQVHVHEIKMRGAEERAHQVVAELKGSQSADENQNEQERRHIASTPASHGRQGRKRREQNAATVKARGRDI